MSMDMKHLFNNAVPIICEFNIYILSFFIIVTSVQYNLDFILFNLKLYILENCIHT